MPIDVRELLEQGAPAPLRDVDVDAVAARGRQWRRRRNATAATVVATVVALAVLPLPRLLSTSPDVLFGPQPEDAVVGTWVSTDTEGGSRTMDISVEDSGRYRVVANDTAGTVCSGVATTDSATDRPDSAGPALTVPLLQCETAILNVPPDGVPLEETRDYTLVYDAETATLSDNLGFQWQRPSPDPAPSDDEGEAKPTNVLWPQSNMKEARAAQARANGGDPAYTWQVDQALDEEVEKGRGPVNAEIFTRFLTEELGWDQFRCCEQTHNDSLSWSALATGSVEVDFIRCGNGSTNTMYPDDPDGAACPPTLGKRGYETVRVSAYQPVDKGPNGIWVIHRSEAQEPFRQVRPFNEAEIAEGIEPYLEARVSGASVSGSGPEQAGPYARVPLLYETSDGSPYERFDYEVVEGPTWPFSVVHLKARLVADGGDTVVEQPFILELDPDFPPSSSFLTTMLSYASDDTPTTENGTPVPVPYETFNGRITVAADPTAWSETLSGQHGPGTLTLVLDNQSTHVLAVVADPLTPTGTCDVGEQPASADALIRNVRSLPNLSVSEPQPVLVGAIDAVQLDITAGDQGQGCVVPPGAPEQPHPGPAVVAPRPDHNHPELRLWWGLGREYQARLYVFDVPGGTPSHTVAILVMAPKADFSAVLDAAQPILDSLAD